MQKIYYLLLVMLYTSTLHAANCVTAKQISIDYKNKTVTFTLTWNGCSGTTTHLNRVWAFVDIQPIDNVENKGAWGPASFTEAVMVTNGTPATVTGNTRGFYVTGNNGATATIKVKLNTTATKFNWCSYATDYPPNVSAYSGSVYTFKGTPSFVVNSISRSAKTYTGTLTSLTDASGCPGCIGRNMPVNGAIPCCPELTGVNGYCRNLIADGASTYIGCGVEVYATDAVSFNSTVNSGCPSGNWRWPSSSELLCIANAGILIPNTNVNTQYFSNERTCNPPNSQDFGRWDYTQIMYSPKSGHVVCNCANGIFDNPDWNASQQWELRGCNWPTCTCYLNGVVYDNRIRCVR